VGGVEGNANKTHGAGEFDKKGRARVSGEANLVDGILLLKRRRRGSGLYSA